MVAQVLAVDDFITGGTGVDLTNTGGHHLNTNTNWCWRIQNVLNSLSMPISALGHVTPANASLNNVATDIIFCVFDKTSANAYLTWDADCIGVTGAITLSGANTPGQIYGVVGRYTSAKGLLFASAASRSPSYYAAYLKGRADGNGWEIHLKCVVGGITQYDVVAQLWDIPATSGISLRLEMSDLEKSVWCTQFGSGDNKVISVYDNFVSEPGGAGLLVNFVDAAVHAPFYTGVVGPPSVGFQVDSFRDVNTAPVPVQLNATANSLKSVGNGFIDSELLDFVSNYSYVYNLPGAFVDTVIEYGVLEVQNQNNLGPVQVIYAQRSIVVPPKTNVAIKIDKTIARQILFNGSGGRVPFVLYSGIDVGYQVIFTGN